VPILIHLDGVVFHPLARNRHALFVCMFEDVLTVLMVDRIQYVEEVFAVAIPQNPKTPCEYDIYSK
jgi:hypothetical protein